VRDRVWIFAGLAVFVAAFTVPFWHAHARASVRQLELVRPAGNKECVAPAGTMRAAHMQMLLSWREDVVRRGDRRYIAMDGKVYEKSLTKTCLGCHSKREFCDRCHSYSGVSGPYCWNCHSAPQAAVARVVP
jgi:hypothetical protein